MSTIPENLSPGQRFWRLLKPDRKDITRIYVYAILHGLVNLSLPLGIQAIINFIQGGRVSTSWIVLVIIVISGIAFSGILQIAQLRISENIQQRIFARSSFELAFRIPRIKLESLAKHYAPELMNRFFDTISIQKGLSKILIDFSTASLQVFFGLILLSIYHPFFIVFSIGVTVLLVIVIRLTGYRGLRTSINESKNKYDVAYWLEEMARLNVTFKQSGSTELPLYRTDGYVSSYLNSRESHFKVLLSQYGLMVGFKVIIATALLAIGGVLVMQQQMNIGQFVAAEIIILLIMSSVEKLIMSIETIYDVLTSLEKLGQVTDLELEENISGVKLPNDGEPGMDVEFKNVTFRYPDDDYYIFEGASFTLRRGETMSISGPSGSGKSSVLGLLSALFAPQQGTISYNGFAVGSIDKEALRGQIGHYHTRDSLFHGTLRENITMGRESVSMDQLMRVIRAMKLDDTVKGLKEGIHTYLDPEGIKLPKSVSIKIILARCIVHQPRLLLLEDNFSLLDKQEKSDILSFLFSPERPWSLLISTNDYDITKMCTSHIGVEDKKIIKLNQG